MDEPPPEAPPASTFEHVETLLYAVAFFVTVSMPVWVAWLAAEVIGAPFFAVCAPLAVAVLIAPAVVRTSKTRALTPAQRWGRNLGAALHAPIRAARALTARGRRRALGAGATSAAVRALDQGDDDR